MSKWNTLGWKVHTTYHILFHRTCYLHGSKDYGGSWMLFCHPPNVLSKVIIQILLCSDDSGDRTSGVQNIVDARVERNTRWPFWTSQEETFNQTQCFFPVVADILVWRGTWTSNWHVNWSEWKWRSSLTSPCEFHSGFACIDDRHSWNNWQRQQSRRIRNMGDTSETKKQVCDWCLRTRGGTGTRRLPGSGRVLHYPALPGPGRILL